MGGYRGMPRGGAVYRYVRLVQDRSKRNNQKVKASAKEQDE